MTVILLALGPSALALLPLAPVAIFVLGI